MIKRGLVFLPLTVFLLTVSVVQAQQPRRLARLGFLSVTSRTAVVDGLLQGLRDAGYIEGQNVAIEYRWAEWRHERLPGLAADLVRLGVDVIIAGGGTEAPQAIKEVSKTVPIVFVIADDPVASGLVSSFARPGGNITGFSSMNSELDGKRLEILREAVPTANRIAVLFNPLDPASPEMWKSMTASARALGVQLHRLDARRPDEFETAMRAAVHARAGAVMVPGFPAYFQAQRRIGELAAQAKLPAISPWRQFPDGGGLMSYGADVADMFRRAAHYVDRILKGAKPSELPVERPLKFELVINLKTAKQIGLLIPPNVLARADRVIK